MTGSSGIWVLGTAMSHDATAVLLRGHEIVAGIEEERLSRVKHASSTPAAAMRFCLAQAGIRAADLDYVAVSTSEQHLRSLALRALDPTLDPAHRALEALESALGHRFRPEQLRFVPHHLAHAESAWAVSGFDRGLVVTADGVGEETSGLLLEGRGRTLEVLREIDEPSSLGHLYLEVTRYLGYRLFDEYKVMGLAPYGDPARHRRIFEESYTLLPEGAYRVDRDRLVAGLYRVCPPRQRGQRFMPDHEHLAASLQEALERIALHMLAGAEERTGQRSLCFAGGVALNCTLNGRIANSGLFDRIFVQPAAHDGGLALGAALRVVAELDPEGPAPKRLRHVYLGSDVGGDEAVGALLEAWGDLVEFERVPDIAAHAAAHLARGAVIGWAQGRSELGPRALGHRSILADPRPAENKRLINAMIKRREAYRPFAPAVLEEHAAELFELPPAEVNLAFMSFALPVRPEHRERLGAVTHVDGSARVQTVSKVESPRFWRLIDAFRELTGVPVLLNTSFNNDVEPIVDSAEDALVTFLTTELHFLAVGDWWVQKRPTDPAAYLGLVPSLARHARALEVVSPAPGGGQAVTHAISHHTHNTFEHQQVPISPGLYALLRGADGKRSIGELLEPGDAELLGELLGLWSRRLVILRPRAGAE